jgi:hypothetical protein
MRGDVTARLVACGVGAGLVGLAACGGDKATGSGAAGGTPVALDVGQSVLYLDSVPHRLALSVAAGGQYIFAVVNTSAAASAAESFDFHGTGGPRASVVANGTPESRSAAARALAARSTGVGPRHAMHTPSPEGMAVHLAMLDADRRIFRRIVEQGGLAAIRARSAAGAAGRMPPGVVRTRVAGTPGVISATPGAANRVFVRNNLSGSCGQVDTVTARTVFASNKLIVLEDNASSTAHQLDAFFTNTLAAEYDTDTYPEVVTNFGDPLLIDSVAADSLQHLGRVTALISPVLNTTLHGVAGFVNPCDFLPNGFVLGPGDTVRSNDTEITYLFAADNSGATTAFSTAEWEPFIRSVLAHESKHVASFAQHLSDGAANFETSWLEEATAQMSAEIWARNFLPTSWKGGDGYQATVGCELGQNSACAAGTPLTYSDSHIPFLYEFMNRVETESVLGPATESKYGGSWMFVRWSTDQYATSEAAYLKSIIDDPTDTGLANLSAQAGAPANALVLQYYLALASSHFAPGFTPADAHLTTPSYDLRDLFAGVAQLHNPSFPLAYPLVPRPVTTGSFDVQVTGIRGGGASVFLLSGAGSGSQSMQLLANGSPLPSTSKLRLGIVRVK